MAWYDALTKAASDGADAYTANRTAKAATANAAATQATATSNLLSSRNLMIGGGILAAVLVLIVVMRSRK